MCTGLQFFKQDSLGKWTLSSWASPGIFSLSECTSSIRGAPSSSCSGSVLWDSGTAIAGQQRSAPQQLAAPPPPLLILQAAIAPQNNSECEHPVLAAGPQQEARTQTHACKHCRLQTAGQRSQPEDVQQRQRPDGLKRPQLSRETAKERCSTARRGPAGQAADCRRGPAHQGLGQGCRLRPCQVWGRLNCPQGAEAGVALNFLCHDGTLPQHLKAALLMPCVHYYIWRAATCVGLQQRQAEPAGVLAESHRHMLAARRTAPASKTCLADASRALSYLESCNSVRAAAEAS